MLDLRQLAVLQEVARTGSFAGASRSLGRSAQAVAQAIGRLEAQTGTVLVVRGTSGSRLTQSGEALVRHARPLLVAAARAETEVRALSGEAEVPVLEIASVRAGWYQTDLIDDFASRTGGLLRVTVQEPAVALRELVGGRVGAVIGFDPDLTPLRRPPRLRWVEVLREPIWLACHPDHPAAAAAEVDLRDLRDARWLGQPPGSPLHRYLLTACRAAGFEPQLVHCGESYDLLDPLRRNRGVTLCSSTVVPEQGLVTRPLVQPLHRTLFVAWRPDTPAEPDPAVLPDLVLALYLGYCDHTPDYREWLEVHPEALLLPRPARGRPPGPPVRLQTGAG